MKSLLSIPNARRVLGAALALSVAALAAAPAAADDRDLFQAAAESPYVMMLLDTSGSMNAQLNGTIALGDQANPGARFYQAKAAVYDVVRGLDDRIRLGFAHFPQPGSEADRKHYLYRRATGQANPGWWDVLQWPLETDNVSFGRWVVDGDNADYRWCNNPTNNRGRLNAFPKLDHDGTVTTTIYTNNINGNGQRLRVRFTGLPANTLGDPTFDLQINVTAINADCTLATGGNARNQTATITMVPAFTDDGDPQANKPFLDAAGNQVAFDYFSRYNHSGIGTILDWTRFSDCGESVLWEPNENNATGTNSSEGQFAYPTEADPFNRDPTDGAFDRGDVIPWDWRGYPQPFPTAGFEHSSKNEILYRLAPNTRPDPVTGQPVEAYVVTAADKAAGLYPGFEAGEPLPILRAAYYFEQEPVSGTLALRAPYVDSPPVFIGIFTPLAGMLNATSAWFDEWEPFAADVNTGDSDFQCREKFVILLSDGAETCGGNPGTAADGLYGRGVKTFVVGFGAGVTAGSLQAIANNGGTGGLDRDGLSPATNPKFAGRGLPNMGDATNGADCNDFNDFDQTTGNVVGFNFCLGYDPATITGTPPAASNGVVIAQTKAELVNVLSNIFDSLQSAQASFASAAVPAAQVESEDSIFLTSFTPQDGTNRWPGELAHFIRPLPTVLNSAGDFVPNYNATCSGSDPTSCLAWEAGAAMLPQAPPDDSSTASWNDMAIEADPTVVNGSVLRVGNGQNQRRILYGDRRRNGGDRVGYPNRRLLPHSNINQERDLWTAMGITFTANDTASELAARTEAALVMRDVVVRKMATDAAGVPFEFILGDLFHSDPVQLGQPVRPEYLASNLPAGSNADCSVSDQGYRCFFEKHRYRRQVVFAGANDGMLHAFDAGRFQSSVVGGQQEGTFGIGTGRELFAYVPREELSRLYDMRFNSSRHEFSVDGPVRIDDFYMDPFHTGSPTDGDREWRSVLIGGLREGGNSYYALDVTQPDQLTTINGEQVPTSSNYVPSCITGSYSTTSCGPNRYGRTLWEYTDSDLGNTWSLPNTGRIEVLDSSGNPVVKYVAVFGGGIDPDDSSLGRHLYIVDVETGKHIYKRQLDSAAPSEPAAVDTDGDALIDTIYIGTVGGFMYKVDLSTPTALTSGPGGDPLLQDPSLDPFAIFDTGGRPVFFPPSVLFVGDLGRYALAFGTGDREDMWNTTVASQEGRFYVLLDDGFTMATGFDETDYEIIDAEAPSTGGNVLLTPSTGNQNGYVITLDPGEKVVTRAFALSGVTAFSTFIPDTAASAGICQRSGFGQVYTFFTPSGNGLQEDSLTGQTTRYRETDQPVFSNPFTEVSSGNSTAGSTAGDLTSDLERIRDELKSFLPDNCRFTSQTVNINAVRADTGIEFIAPVPICVISKNWKEGPFE
ncbi:MAG: PilC/PilY family type IV pilus protein [Acidobacteriota bacterium]